MPPISTASVAIDLGSSVITTVVGGRNEHGRLHILGVGQSPSAGIEAGQISHVSRAAGAIRHSIEQAESSAAREILSVGIAVSGAHLQSMNNRGAVALPSSGEPIRDADLVRAIDSGRAVTINASSTLLHAIPRYYVVDSERRSFDPRGQHGQRLDVSMHLVTASQSAIQNAAHCIQNAGVDVELIAAKPVVAAERAVRGDEKEFGVLVVGLDAGTTTLTAFEDGAISHTSAIQIGTSHIARDLSIGLHCTSEEARRVMHLYGQAVPQLVPDDAADIELRGFSPGSGNSQSAHPSFVAEIINARVSEIISMISARITEHQLQQAVAGGVVLTGSGAMLGGVDLLFSKAMESPARVAGAGDLYGLTDRLSRPDALGAVGMLDWMLDSSDVIQPNRNRALSRSPDSAGSMLSSIASGVAGLARVFSPNS
ncbi:MAG: cell division protein FtsA [Chloroflexota bacterium]|nr:cell division protein FtsA [Chloroflexota bacterium]